MAIPAVDFVRFRRGFRFGRLPDPFPLEGFGGDVSWRVGTGKLARGCGFTPGP